jgi:hypothetical protein
LVDYLLFYVPLKNFSLMWRRWRAAKFRPILGAQGLWAGRDFYRATSAVTRGLGFTGLIRRTAPFNRILRLARGCGGPILTQVLAGSIVIKPGYCESPYITKPNFSMKNSSYYELCKIFNTTEVLPLDSIFLPKNQSFL